MSNVKRPQTLRRKASWSRGAKAAGSGAELPHDSGDTVGGSDPTNLWPRFVESAAARLQQGRVAYGDRSFFHEPDRLVREIEEELLDVAVWAFILWTRMRRLPVVTRGVDRQRERRRTDSAAEKLRRRGSTPAHARSGIR